MVYIAIPLCVCYVHMMMVILCSNHKGVPGHAHHRAFPSTSKDQYVANDVLPRHALR